MSDDDDRRAAPMPNPPHLGEPIRESMDEVGWTVTGTARHRDGASPGRRHAWAASAGRCRGC